MRNPSVMARTESGDRIVINTYGSDRDVWLSFENVQVNFRGGAPEVTLLRDMLTKWLESEGVTDERITL